jgi:hypothetical protein
MKNVYSASWSIAPPEDRAWVAARDRPHLDLGALREGAPVHVAEEFLDLRVLPHEVRFPGREHDPLGRLVAEARPPQVGGLPAAEVVLQAQVAPLLLEVVVGRVDRTLEDRRLELALDLDHGLVQVVHALADRADASGTGGSGVRVPDDRRRPACSPARAAPGPQPDLLAARVPRVLELTNLLGRELVEVDGSHELLRTQVGEEVLERS